MIIDKNIKSKVNIDYLFIEGKVKIDAKYFINQINQNCHVSNTHIVGEMTNFNFFNTVKIQYFVGYSEGPNNEAQMKSPLWAQLGSADFARISEQNSNVLCRFTKTSNGPFSKDSLDFPMYNEYFFIDNTSTSLQRKYNFDNQNMLESPESSDQPRLEAQPARTVPEESRSSHKKSSEVTRATQAIKNLKKSLSDFPD